MGQPTIPPTPAGTSMAGKTVIITGGNAGLGLEAARQFLILKVARVIITVRSQSKGDEAVSALRADPVVKAVNPSAKVEAFLLDLNDYESGMQFTQKVKQELSELDILLCNGGMSIIHYQVSKSGHEEVMQVNCYTHFLIVLELLPLLRSTALKRDTPSRLTFVGSNMQVHHTLGKHPVSPTQTVFAHFDDRQIYDSMRRYGDSKLALNAFCRRLATVVSPNEVIVNNLCPGMVATGLDKGLPVWLRTIMSIIRKFVARTVEEGGRTLIYAAVIAGPETHGKFIQNNKVDLGAPFLDEAVGKEFIDKLWTGIAAEVKEVDPKLESIV